MFGDIEIFCLLILSILKFHTSLSNDAIGCDSLEDFQDFANREPLDLQFYGDIQTFSDVNIKSLVPQQNKVYIDARLEMVDDRVDLIIFTTENFKRYLYEQTSMHIALDVIFECSDGKKRLLFYQPLKEGNYFSPEFSKDVYTFSIPTPLYKGFDLTSFEEISAIDYDLMGNNIEFSSTDSENFKISIRTLKSDGKTSFASLELMAILLSVKEQFEFTIIATDNGNPPRTSSAMVVITADSSNSLPPVPQFVKTVVYASLTAHLQLFELEIILEPATYSTDVSFRKIGDDEDIFKIENVKNIVYVNLNRALDLAFLKGKERLTFDVEATNSRLTESGRIAVMVFIPEKKGLTFEKELYEGKLFVKSNLLEIEDFVVKVDEIELTNFEVQLEGQQSYLFDEIHNENVVKLSLKPNLGADIWDNINYVSLKLLAKVNSDESASTNIIIDVIHTIIYFNKPAYKGFINIEGKLVLDKIVILSNAATTDDVDIKLLQADAELFSYIKLGNEIELKLEGNINTSELKNKSYLSMEIEAKETSTEVKANCFVFIEKPTTPSVIKYEKTIYEAQLSSEDKSITQEVALDKDSYDDGIEFALLGPNAQYFSFQQSKNILNVSLNEDFNTIDHPDTNYLWVELKALNPSEKLETSAVVIFNIIQETIPEFEEPNYTGEITEENVLKLGKIVLKTATWKTYTLINVTGGYSKFFDHTVNENKIEISLKSELSDEVRLHSSIVLVVTASNNAVKGYSTVIINMPQSRNLSNIFKEPIQKGSILEDANMQVLKIEDIELAKEYNVADFTCKLSGDESNYMDHAVIAPKNVIKLILAAEFPTEIIQIHFYLTFLLECQKNDDSSIAGSTVIFLSLPGSNGSQNCPTPDPPTFIPEFQNAFYSFYAKPTDVGPLQSVHAMIRESDDEIRYSLHVGDEHLRSRINIDSISGELSLSSLTSPGRYYFDIIAENVVTHGQAQAKGRLDIEAIIQCEDHMTVSNSLLIKYLEEEADHKDIFDTKFENCEFYVFSMDPYDREYVKIDPVSKKLTMISTDREDAVFAQMFLPQIEVKLKLHCSDKNTRMGNFNLGSRSARDVRQLETVVENRSLVLTNDISFAKDVTVLSIVLVDINDNQPEFIFPKQDRLVVGFPEQDIEIQIFSENLLQVVALDKDEGLNSKIRYSIQPNEHFQIDPISGEVHPYANAMKGISEIDLIVYAIDRNGDSDGLRSKFTMCVKILKREHFALLTFINEDVKSIDTLMEIARSRTGIDMIAVKHATLSSMDNMPSQNVGRFRTGSIQFIQKVWIYAFEGGVPITSKDIKEKLSEYALNISAQTLDEVMQDSLTEGADLTCIQNVTGYITGLCVLAVLVIACIGLIFWIYRNRNIAHDEKSNNLSARGPNQNFNLKQGAEINIQKQTELLSDAPYEPSLYSKRESVKILGTTTQESTDDGKRRQLEKLNSSLNGHMHYGMDEHESDSSNESRLPRATVTFNELVERIHIESDDEEKTK